MTNEHLLDAVTAIVAATLHRTPEACPLAADIFTELGGDELDRLDIDLAVEDKFGIELSDDDYGAWRSIGELAALIRREPQEAAA